MGVVYIARNIINDKCYVGKTTATLKKRMRQHLSAAERGDGYYFHRALLAYGKESFIWNVIAESDSQDELSKIECDSIEKLNCRRPNGYNLTRGGDGVVGRTPDVMAKIIAFHTGRKRSEETRRRISLAMRGKKTRLGSRLTDEQKKKISESMTGFSHTQEAKQKISSFMKGRPKTEEQKRKMSEARKRWWEESVSKKLAAGEYECDQGDMFAGVKSEADGEG